MSQNSMKKNDQLYYLDNVFWKRENFVNNQIILHSIKCQKVSEEAAQYLKGKDFVIVDSQFTERVTVGGKNVVQATEMQEVHLDNLKVTEASIVSHSHQGQKTKVFINEGAPTEDSRKLIDEEMLRVENGNVFSISDIVSENKKKIKSKTIALNSSVQRDYKKVEHEHIVFRQEIARKKNSFFFRVKDSPNLFKLGSSYYDDMKTGCKHFGFINAGANEIQKRSILGIASFIHYHENFKIIVLTDTMYQSFFAPFKKDEFIIQSHIAAYPEFKYNVYLNEGLHFLEVEEIIKKSNEHSVKGLEYLFQKLLADYDVVFYDLPALDTNKGHDAIYFSQLQTIENISFVVNLKADTFSEIEDLKKYFSNYKIKIKGIVTGAE